MGFDMLRPCSETELSEIIAAANAPLRIQGGGTRPVGQIADHQVLSTSALNGITLYEPGALTLVALAGTPISEVADELAKNNQRLPFEPMDHRGLLGTDGTPTIGGVLATNTAGPRRIQVGAARDLALGVRFVDGQGTVLKNGGRVMKNVTGYDLLRLMAGAWGTLGVLTEVAFKVLPMAEAVADVSVEIETPENAVAAMSAALGSPYDVSGAAFENGKVHIRVEGFTESVEYRQGQLSKLLGIHGTIAHSESPPDIWEGVRDVRAFHGSDGDVWKISVKPTDGPKVCAVLPGDYVMDWGGGLIWALVPKGIDLRAKLTGIPGHATLIRADAETKAKIASFEPADAAIAALSQGIKQKFDPRGILNPGRMV